MKKSSQAIASTLSALLLSAMLGACGGDSPEKLIASSKEFIAKRDNKAAIIQLKNALQANPNLGEARFLLGKALLESSDVAGALVELRKAKEMNFASEQTIPLLAKAILMSGDARKVTEEFAKTELPSQEATANLKTTLSQAYAVQGKLEAAKNSLSAALSAQPDNAQALLTKAQISAAEGKLDEAQLIVDSVLANHPKDQDALLFDGMLKAGKGNLDEANVLFQKAIEAKPDFLIAHSAYIGNLFKQQKFDEAGKQVDILKKVAPSNPQTIYLDGLISYQKKDYKRARELTQQLLKFAPNNANTLQLAGATEFRLASYIQAESYLSKALQLAPDLPLARRLLVSSYLQIGQPAKAIATLKPVLERNDDPSLLSLAGEAYLQNGDASKAAEFFAKASKMDPGSNAKKTSLAIARLAQGNASAAFEDLEHISQNDTGASADLALIAAYSRANQIDKALKAIDNLEKKQPNNPATYNLRARTLIAKKDVTGARQNFEKALSINPKFFQATAGLAALDLAEKKPESAQKRFEALLAADPSNGQALLALAEIRANNGGSSDEVTALINKAIAANPSELAPRLALIQLHLRDKDNKKALAAANNAVAAMPDKTELLDVLGRIQRQSGDLNQALSTYGKMSNLLPNSPLPYIRIAELHIINKNTVEATKSLKKALELKPDFLDAQRALITLAMEAKRPSDALVIARQIETQRPKEGIGYILEGDIHANNKAWPESIAAFRNGLKQVDSAELAIKLYSALIASGNNPEAEKMAATWFKEHPKDVALRIHLGDLATIRKDYSAANQHYRIALDIQPNNPLLLNNLAWVWGQQKLPKALEYAEKANQLAPNQPPYMDTLAMLLAERGENDRAIQILRKALEISPQAALIQLNLAKVLVSAGKKDEARKELDALAKLGDKFAGQSEVSKLQKSL